jgi:hypothetical protein
MEFANNLSDREGRDIRVAGKKRLESSLVKRDIIVWTGYIWHRVGTDAEPL